MHHPPAALQGPPAGTVCSLCHGCETGESLLRCGHMGGGVGGFKAPNCLAVLCFTDYFDATFTTADAAAAAAAPATPVAADHVPEESRGLGGRSEIGLGEMILVRVSGERAGGWAGGWPVGWRAGRGGVVCMYVGLGGAPSQSR